MKLISIVGARPQFIKVKPITDQFSKRKINHKLIHTGQHYDYEMSRVFFDQMNIPNPDYNLEIGSSSHGKQTGLMLEKIEEVLIAEKPDFVIVYGDTNSTIAAALAAVKIHIPIVHIEAGLRSFNMTMPEEANRRLTDHISTLLFCPTDQAVKNLYAENIKQGVHKTGDIMYDMFLEAAKLIDKKSKILDSNGLKSKQYLLLTLHRASNVDDSKNLEEILSGTNDLGQKIIFPVHPRTQNQLNKISMSRFPNIHCIKPVSYLDMVNLEKSAKAILTDSGGVQKEAYFAEVPCITLREETEWIETLESGWNILAGSDKNRIKKAWETLNPGGHKNLYGIGDCAKQIADVIFSGQ